MRVYQECFSKTNKLYKYEILICHSYGGSIGLRGTIGFGGIQVGDIGSLISINTSKRFCKCRFWCNRWLGSTILLGLFNNRLWISFPSIFTGFGIHHYIGLTSRTIVVLRGSFLILLGYWLAPRGVFFVFFRISLVPVGTISRCFSTIKRIILVKNDTFW